MKHPVRNFFRYVSRHTPILLLSILLMAAVGAFEALVPVSIKIVFDNFLNPANPNPGSFEIPYFKNPLNVTKVLSLNPESVWLGFAVFIVLIAFGKGFCEYVGNYLVQFAGHSVVMDLRNDLYRKIINQAADFFHRHSTGRLISHITNDIEKIQTAASVTASDALKQSFILIAMVALVIQWDWKLALIALAVAPVIILLSARFGQKIRHTSRSSQDNLADISNLLHETITANRIVKAFGTEKLEFDRFRAATRSLLYQNLKWVRIHALSSPLMELLGAIAIAVLLFYARGQIMSQRLTQGEFVAFLFALIKMFDPLRRMSGINNSFQQAFGATARVFEFLELPEEVKEKPHAKRLKQFKDEIRFEQVSFQYPGELFPILRNISATVKKGEVIAVAGSSGAGKTTLVNLIPRFFDVTSGAILIDGLDIRDVTLKSLRELIGMVTQETILFNDTVVNNIAYGQARVDLTEVEQAAKAALAHDFILQLPQGYHTVIGERGQRLSGGERQRIAIARAILKNAPILILDEATSALDSESERYVQRALANLMSGRTVFVIAHRLSTVRSADKIVVINEGEISEIGTHQDLVEKGGIYHRLHSLQFADADATW